MNNPENTIVENGNEVPQHKPNLSSEVATVSGIDLPAPETAKQPRNQHLKVNEPKNKQFAARATETDFNTINSAMQANGCRDIVELMLFSINLHRKDILSPFKLK